MLRELRTSIILLILFLVLLAGVYPYLIETVSQKIFPSQANGSLVLDASGQVMGSDLIAQGFVSDKYFHPRPSSAGQGYDAANSSGANAIVSSKDFVKTVKERADGLHIYGNASAIPIDMVTTSASGLDPDISVNSALYQAGRVAEARGIPTVEIEELVRQNITMPSWGVLGPQRINVLHLNMILDHLPIASAP